MKKNGTFTEITFRIVLFKVKRSIISKEPYKPYFFSESMTRISTKYGLMSPSFSGEKSLQKKYVFVRRSTVHPIM